jgi:hypothetical protein
MAASIAISWTRLLSRKQGMLPQAGGTAIVRGGYVNGKEDDEALPRVDE